MADTPTVRTVAVAVADLLFGARIRAAAEQADVRPLFARNAEELVRHAMEAEVVIIDLDTRWLDVATDIRALRDHPAITGKTIIAFVAHTRVDLINAAREAGADQVLARSAFVRILTTLFNT